MTPVPAEGMPPDEIVLTRKMVAEFQELTKAARAAISQMTETERWLFANANATEPLPRSACIRHAQALLDQARAEGAALAVAERAFQAEFDKYHLARASAEARRPRRQHVALPAASE
jgi:hypothetical protein